jgi:hypothetical protein
MFNLKAATLGVISLLGAAAMAAEPGDSSATMARPIVVELFTSQGCSSCPPADALLGELAREPDVIALAFHVQYWDSLGWSDRFGLPESALRQNRYTQQLHLASSFTPQLIIEGSASLLGSDRNRIQATLGRLRAEGRRSIHLQGEIRDGVLLVDVPGGAALPAGADLLLLPLLPQADSTITRGENGGHTLREFNIVRAARVLGRWDGQARQYRVPLASLPADSSRAALLLQARGQGPVLAAAMVGLR